METTEHDPFPRENDDKENGPRPAADTEQHRINGRLDIIAEIRKELAGRDVSSLAELQALAKRISQEQNLRPRDEFCGLSPEQMHRFLHFPVDSPEIVEFSENFQNPPEAPVLTLASFLIDACGDNGLKATAKGYLPQQFCRETAISFFGEEGYKERKFGSEVRKELDFPELHVVRLVAQMAGLVRKYRGKFLLTKKCKKLLSSPANGKLYLELFTAYTWKFNWGYRDGYEDFHIIQESFLFSLFLLRRFGSEFRYPAFYEERFLQAFPAVLDEVCGPLLYKKSKEEYVGLCYSLRTMRRFAHFFGLIELNNISPMLISQSYEIKKRPLLDQLLTFHV